MAVRAVGFGEEGEQVLQATADGGPRDQTSKTADFFRQLGLGTALFACQKAEGEHDQGDIVVEAAPGAALEVVEPEFFLHLLVALLDLPTFVPKPHYLDPGGVGGQVAEGVLERAVGLLLDE